MTVRRPIPRPPPPIRRPSSPTPKQAPKPPAPRNLYKKDELSTGQGGALRAKAAQYLQATKAPLPPSTTTTSSYTVLPGDSYHRIAQNQATAYLASQGMSQSDPAYSSTWHRLAHRLVQDLMASNGGRALKPGDTLLLPDPAKYGLVPGVIPPAPVDPGQVTPGTPGDPGQVPPTPPQPVVPGDVGNVLVNQFVGDPDGRNGNCGFASSLMALRALGIDSPALTGSDYEQAMKLRALGGGGTNDREWGTVGQVVAALDAAGANASAVPNTWGSNKLQAVELMKQAFLSGTPTAFVAAGNPALGWPDQVSYNGGHFVTVTGYDPKSNTFTVLDPIAQQPIQVTPEQLAAYLKDGNAESGELIQVTR